MKIINPKVNIWKLLRYFFRILDGLLGRLNEIEILSSCRLRECHLRVSLLGNPNCLRSGVFHKQLDAYLQLSPCLIMKFRYEANSFQTYKRIEHYQGLLLKEQTRLGASQSGPRIISSETFVSNSNTHAYLDAYIKSRILEESNAEELYVCLTDSERKKVKNEAMFGCWLDLIKLISVKEARSLFGSDYSAYVDDITWTIYLNGKMTYIEHAKPIVQKKWEEKRMSPLLTLSPDLIENGRDELEKLGLPRSSWFVTLHVRDSGAKTGSWENHDPFDGHRNADIDSYLPAIDAITSAGGFVLRVGDPSMKPLPVINKVIDYAHSTSRSSSLDVFLFTQCKFFIGTASGPILMPIIFGVPTIATNFAPIYARLHASNTITINKKYFLNTKRQYLSLEEALSGEVSDEFDNTKFQKVGIDLIDNSPQEILGAVLEMCAVLEGSIAYSSLEEELNYAANSLYDIYSGYGNLGRIGKTYLMNLYKMKLLKVKS
jgi:putative glycosyltransferase (TIGR04372 family)